MKEVKIKLENVYKAFGKKAVLRGVNLDIYKGESLVVIGGSGTGKSVLIKCIQGLLTPEEGSIKVDDREVVGIKENDKEALHSKMGMLFQGGALFDSLSVWENVAFDLLENRGVNKKDAKAEAIRVLRSVGLDPDVADLSPSELSGGMQKRVGLARAIISKPEIIFFDEPTTGLDPIMAVYMGHIIHVYPTMVKKDIVTKLRHAVHSLIPIIHDEKFRPLPIRIKTRTCLSIKTQLVGCFGFI